MSESTSESTSESIRMPGPVTDEAHPIHNSRSAPCYSTQNTPFPNSTDRKPGEVTDAAETIVEPKEEGAATDDAELFQAMEGSPWRLVLLLLGATITCWFIFDAVVTVSEAFERSWWFGIPLAVVTIALLVALAWAAHREWSAFQSVDQLARRQGKINAALETNDLYGLRDALSPTLENIRKRQPGLIRVFEDAASQRESAADYFTQFDNLVLTVLDQQAAIVIKQAMLTGGAGVAVSPHPALDAFIVLWRAKSLIKSIGEIYGLEPTGLSAMRLVKHAIVSAMIAGALEEFSNAMAAQMTQNAFIKALKPLGESAATATRLYRLGKLTQRFCRPNR